MEAITRRLRRSTGRVGAAAVLVATVACGDAPATTEVEPSLSRGAGHGGSSSPLGFVAKADFYQSDLETCYETVAEVSVTETGGESPEATLDFRYYVFGICGGQEGLYYYDLDTLGEIPVDPDDVTVHPGLRWATLDTEILVYDGESGTSGTIHLVVTWERTGGKEYEAELAYAGRYTSHPGVNPIETEDAQLVRLTP